MAQARRGMRVSPMAAFRSEGTTLIASYADWSMRRAIGLVVTEYQLVKDLRWALPPARDTFSPAELPMILVCGCGGKTITLTFFDASNGRELGRVTEVVRKSTVYGRSFLQATGSFRVELAVAGAPVQSAAFRIIEAAPAAGSQAVVPLLSNTP